MATFGDIPANISIGASQSVRRNSADSAFEAARLDLKQVSFNIVNPVSNTGGLIYCAFQGLTLLQVDSVIIGSSSPRLDFNIEIRSSPGTSGSDFTNPDMSPSTSGLRVNSGFINTSVAQGSWLYLDISRKDNTVNQLCVTITFVVT